MSPRAIASIPLVAVGSLLLAAAVASWAPAFGIAADPQVRRIDLQQTDSIVAGTLGPDGRAWLLARQSQAERLVLYSARADGSIRRSTTPLPAAGSLAAIALAPDGSVWIGAGQRLARIDSGGGAATALELPRPASVVTTAVRDPDGVVLGWGQVTGIAVDTSGSVWVARYAVSELTRIETSGRMSRLPLPDTDADRLTATIGGVWFTTNFGAGTQLGASIGVVDPSTASLRLVALKAAVLVPTARGIEVLGAARSVVDPTTLAVTGGAMPGETLSLAAVAATGSNLIARVGGRNRLMSFDTSGRAVRTIDFDGGSFQTRGRVSPLVAPLVLLAAATDGAVWFAPKGGSSLYIAR